MMSYSVDIACTFRDGKLAKFACVNNPSTFGLTFVTKKVIRAYA